MNTRFSLRLRLTLIILLPLLVLGAFLGLWAHRDAQQRAQERFDRSLLSMVLGISQGAAFSGGDVLNATTRDLLRETSDRTVYYHVYAPDGVYVMGYATPPVLLSRQDDLATPYAFFDSVYFGRGVRAVRLRDRMSVDGLTGEFTFTVWQDQSAVDDLASALSARTYTAMAVMMTGLVLAVWFGVRLGLRPLSDLEDAIERRSSEDLNPIRRAIPVEVRGVVGRLNTLLGELADTFRVKDDFISDAAHQLRNPISGVLALAESMDTARDPDELKARSRELADAARQAARLTDDLLVYERAKSASERATADPVDLVSVLRAMDQTQMLARLGGHEHRIAQLQWHWELPPSSAWVSVDVVLFEQAVINVINNAIQHGGAELSLIEVTLTQTTDNIVVSVADDGVGMDAHSVDTALARFGQLSPGGSSGLGLPIAKAVVEGAGGTLELDVTGQGLRVLMRFPRVKPES